jgi:hypothetical protein
MKARRIGTTTEFEVEGVIMNGIGYVMEEVEVLPTATELSTEPDWNQIKIQASIAAMQGLCHSFMDDNSGRVDDDYAKIAVRLSDSLITELKKEKP